MEEKVLIYAARLKAQIEVVIPQDQAGDFIIKFGLAFGQKDMGPNGFNEEQIDGYFFYPNGWHVIVSVEKEKIEKFSDFMETFCREKGLMLTEKENLVRLVR